MYAGPRIFVTAWHCGQSVFEYTPTGGRNVGRSRKRWWNQHTFRRNSPGVTYIPCCWWWATFYSDTVLCIGKWCWDHQITQDMSRTCSMHGDLKDSYIMVGKPKGGGNLREICFCEYNIKIDLTCYKIIDCNDVAEGCALWRTFVSTEWTCRSYCVVLWP
jgi:hypothetical protein